MRAPLVPITVMFMAGILIGMSGPVLPMVIVGCGVVCAVAAMRWRGQGTGVVALLLLWGALGLLRSQVWLSHPEMGLKMRLDDEPAVVRLHGIMVNDPVRIVEPGAPARLTGVLKLEHVRIGDEWRAMSGRVRATFHGQGLTPSWEPLRYGDELLVEGKWLRVPAPGNPGQYDWREALARRRIHGLLRVRSFDGVVVLRHGQGHPVLAAVFRLRRRWERLIRAAFPPREAGLLVSLLLGQRAALDPQLRKSFVETGTVHLLVISGFHVGLIALLLELMFRLLGLPWRLRLCSSAVCLGGYCVLAGLHPPVARATLMAWIVLGAFALDRVISWPNTLAATALVILWINPAQLCDPGFQLSFGAVTSLLVFTPRWSAWLEPRSEWIRPLWLGRYLAVSLSVTSAIWVGLAPVLAWYFYLLAPISLLANLVIAPLISGLVCLGTIVLMCGALLEPAVQWGSGILRALITGTVSCVSWLHAIPGGHWLVARPAPFLLMGYYGLIGLSVLRRRLGWSRGRVLVCWVTGLALWVWTVAAVQWRASHWLRVDILDVGHGDSIVVRTPSRHTLVVDAGTEEAGRFRVVPFLRAAGVTSIDALILTHTDHDHMGGAVPILQALPVRRLFTNGVRDDTMSSRRIRHLATAHAIPETVLTAGMILRTGGDLTIEVLHPPRGLVPGAAPASNDNSLVLRVTKGSVSILLTGDIEEAGLPWLLDADGGRQVSVLKVPHHGSRLGRVGERFFSAVHPGLAVLSVGSRHRLPAPETVQALSRTGAILSSTRRDGAVHLRTDGRRLEARTFKSREEWMLEW